MPRGSSGASPRRGCRTELGGRQNEDLQEGKQKGKVTAPAEKEKRKRGNDEHQEKAGNFKKSGISLINQKKRGKKDKGRTGPATSSRKGSLKEIEGRSFAKKWTNGKAIFRSEVQMPGRTWEKGKGNDGNRRGNLTKKGAVVKNDS